MTPFEKKILKSIILEESLATKIKFSLVITSINEVITIIRKGTKTPFLTFLISKG